MPKEREEKTARALAVAGLSRRPAAAALAMETGVGIPAANGGAQTSQAANADSPDDSPFIDLTWDASFFAEVNELEASE